LIGAFRDAGEDGGRTDAERRSFKQSAELIESGSRGHQVALQAFGGADAKIIS
jgi:hypothetical protein